MLARQGLALSANPIADAIFPSRERSLYSIAELRRLPEYLRWGYVPTGEDFVQLSIYDTEYNGRLMIYYGPDRNAGFRLWTSPDHPSFDTL
jgi:hypothetical protein